MKPSRRRTFPLIESTSSAVRLKAARAFVDRFPASTEILLVGASRGAVDDLARSIAAERGIVVGLHRFSFTQLAARSAAAALAGRGLTPGTRLGTEAVAARAAFEARKDRAIAYFDAIAGCPGFPRALARTLQDVRLAGLDSSALASLPLGGADLAELLQQFEEQFAAASASDRAELFEVASATLEQGATPWSRQPLLLLDVPVDSIVEQKFVAAIVGSASDALATVPFGDVAALEAMQAIGGQLDVLEEEGSTDLATLRRHLFDRRPPPVRQAAGDATFFSAPGEAREATEIARRVLEEARRGVRFDEMAIFVRSPKDYLGLLEHALRRAHRDDDSSSPAIEGIPAFFDRGTRRPHPSGRAFLAILSCAVEQLSAKRFAEYLSLGQVPQLDAVGASGPGPGDSGSELNAVLSDDEVLTASVGGDERLQPPQPGAESGDARPGSPEDEIAVVDGTLRAPWKWETLIVESSVIGGDPERWRRRLDGLAKQFRIQIRELRTEEPESPRLRRLERDLRNLQHLRRFALPVIERLAAWPTSATWGEWLDELERIAPLLLRRPARVLRVLAGLRPMAAVGPVSLAEVRNVLSERLLSLEIEAPARRYGRVFVGSPHQARGRAFRVVFIPGLAERMFPQKPREDPLLLDEQRSAGAAAHARLPLQEDRAKTERLLLRLAVGAATERLHLSYPRLETSQGRPRVPSFYALDVMRAITGRIPHHEDLQRAAYEEGSARLSWPAPADPERALDDVEHDLAVLRALIDEPVPAKVKGHAHYILRLNDNLKRSITTRWARARSSWSQHDGLVRVTSQTRAALVRERLAARPYSLSALQKFANCPYQFLLSAIYRLEPAEEPEPLQRLDPLTRGSIFHRIQAEFFRALEAKGLLASPASQADLLEDVIDRIARDYREELAPAIDRVWNDEIADISKDLRVWVRRLPDRDGWQPHRFEFSFGLSDEGRDPRSLPDPVTVDGRFLLRGSIDLLEERGGERELRITDHKTGKARVGDRAIIDGGRVLQPVLYGMVVESALGKPVVSGRLYYCTSAGGFTEHEIPLNERSRRAAVEALEIVDRAVELGFLSPAPAERACAWCDFRPVCGPNEEMRVRRKSQDALGDLIALRSMP
ncbi:MAG TPA: PD-(D/E)XK nuclease family protein [Vicinamibacterales bacterium]|nr:PD-(D/E)XK nuclease family protein [Vicinamibacterales bacterium]